MHVHGKAERQAGLREPGVTHEKRPNAKHSVQRLHLASPKHAYVQFRGEDRCQDQRSERYQSRTSPCRAFSITDATPAWNCGIPSHTKRERAEFHSRSIHYHTGNFVSGRGCKSLLIRRRIQTWISS